MDDLSARLVALEARLECLEDESAIRRLMATYQRLSDDSYSEAWANRWNDTLKTTRQDKDETGASLFSSAGPWWEGIGLSETSFGLSPRAKGNAEFVKFGEERQRWMPRMLHHLTNEDIVVTGREAVGHWYSWEAAIVCVDAQYVPVWIAGRFRVDFVKEHDMWRIRMIRFEEIFSSRADQGDWVGISHVHYGPCSPKQ